MKKKVKLWKVIAIQKYVYSVIVADTREEALQKLSQLPPIKGRNDLTIIEEVREAGE